jgi:hypothetical protein
MSLTKVSFSMIEGMSANVVDFGAVGNDSTDDTAAIQAAIDSGAKSIYFPVGTYKITGTLNVLTENVRLYGEWNSSVIKQYTNNVTTINANINNGSATNLQSGKFTMERLSFSSGYGTSPTSNSIVLKLTNTRQAKIDNCSFVGFYNHIYSVLNLSDGNYYGLINQCVFDGINPTLGSFSFDGASIAGWNVRSCIFQCPPFPPSNPFEATLFEECDFSATRSTIYTGNTNVFQNNRFEQLDLNVGPTIYQFPYITFGNNSIVRNSSYAINGPQLGSFLTNGFYKFEGKNSRVDEVLAYGAFTDIKLFDSTGATGANYISHAPVGEEVSTPTLYRTMGYATNGTEVLNLYDKNYGKSVTISKASYVVEYGEYATGDNQIRANYPAAYSNLSTFAGWNCTGKTALSISVPAGRTSAGPFANGVANSSGEVITYFSTGYALDPSGLYSSSFCVYIPSASVAGASVTITHLYNRNGALMAGSWTVTKYNTWLVLATAFPADPASSNYRMDLQITGLTNGGLVHLGELTNVRGGAPYPYEYPTFS